MVRSLVGFGWLLTPSPQGHNCTMVFLVSICPPYRSSLLQTTHWSHAIDARILTGAWSTLFLYGLPCPADWHAFLGCVSFFLLWKMHLFPPICFPSIASAYLWGNADRAPRPFFLARPVSSLQAPHSFSWWDLIPFYLHRVLISFLSCLLVLPVDCLSRVLFWFSARSSLFWSASKHSFYTTTTFCIVIL